MFRLKKNRRKPFFWLLILVILLSACSNETTPAVEDTLTPEIPKSTPTPEEPTPTPVPAAVLVNGERIPMSWYEDELERFLIAQTAMGQPEVDQEDARETVLNALIDQVLLAQGALETGIDLRDEDVQARIDVLADELDLGAWMAEWGYSEEDLFQSLKMEMLAAYQRDQIAGSVPETADQVELRQILTFTEDGANRAMVSLNSGRTFEDVALTYQPETGGYLGWVPRGYLLIPAVEEVSFNLEAGAYSEIIESDIGYHIVLVIDREERPLTNDARLALQRKAVQAWLEEYRETSSIEVLVD